MHIDNRFDEGQGTPPNADAIGFLRRWLSWPVANTRGRVNAEGLVRLCMLLLSCWAMLLSLSAQAQPFESVQSMAQVRQWHTATLLPGGKVLVSGGRDSNLNALSSAEVYDPASNSWSDAGSMAQGRYYHTATLLPGGKVLVSGGRSNSGVLASAEVYDPASKSWSAAGTMEQARVGHTATLLPGGKVLVSGGQGSNGLALATAEVYDPASNSWSAAGTMAQVRQWHTATLHSPFRASHIRRYPSS